MFLKIFSANLRSLVSVRNSLSVVAGHPSSVSRRNSAKLQGGCGSTSLYSTGKTVSELKNRETSKTQHHETLSSEVAHTLSQNPDSFGILSSCIPSVPIESPESLPREEKPKKSIRKTIEKYETLLQDLVKENKLHEAVDLFEKEMLIKDRILAPTRIYVWLIDECLRVHEYNGAFAVYEHMVNRKVIVPLPIIQKLALSYESSDFPIKKINNLRKLITRYDYEPSEQLYNSLIRSFIRARQWSTGFDLAAEMTQRGFIYEFETANLLLEGCSHIENGFCRMLEMWHTIRGSEYTPNVHTLNALLRCVLKCEFDIHKLKGTVEQIINRASSKDARLNEEKEDLIEDGRPNLLKSPPCLGYLLDLDKVTTPADRLLLLGGLTGILAQMKNYNIQPTLETIALLLKVAPNSFPIQQKVIIQLKNNQIVPSMEVMNLLLKNSCLRQDFNDAKEVIDMMYSFDVEVDLVCYGLLSMSCKTAQEADEFFSQLERNNLPLDVDIVNAMLKKACAIGDNNFVISILRKMRAKGIEPLEDSAEIVVQHQKHVFRSLRAQRKPSQQFRNECFKLSRECKEWLRSFQLDKKPHTNADQRIRLYQKKNPPKTETETIENYK